MAVELHATRLGQLPGNNALSVVTSLPPSQPDFIAQQKPTAARLDSVLSAHIREKSGTERRTATDDKLCMTLAAKRHSDKMRRIREAMSSSASSQSSSSSSDSGSSSSRRVPQQQRRKGIQSNPASRLSTPRTSKHAFCKMTERDLLDTLIQEHERSRDPLFIVQTDDELYEKWRRGEHSSEQNHRTSGQSTFGVRSTSTVARRSQTSSGNRKGSGGSTNQRSSTAMGISIDEEIRGWNSDIFPKTTIYKRQNRNSKTSPSTLNGRKKRSENSNNLFDKYLNTSGKPNDDYKFVYHPDVGSYMEQYRKEHSSVTSEQNPYFNKLRGECNFDMTPQIRHIVKNYHGLRRHLQFFFVQNLV